MGIFTTKKKGEKAEKKEGTTVVSTGADFSDFGVLSAPRITEKAALLSENCTYVFNISPRANKRSIALAVKKLYKVTPLVVRTLSVPSRSVFTRGKHGSMGGGRKAYVTLREGDKIEIM